MRSSDFTALAIRSASSAIAGATTYRIASYWWLRQYWLTAFSKSDPISAVSGRAQLPSVEKGTVRVSFPASDSKTAVMEPVALRNDGMYPSAVPPSVLSFSTLRSRV